jgi:hypothetical protein
MEQKGKTMPIPLRVDKIDDVPEALRDLYHQDNDGAYSLDIDDASYNEKLAEFRRNNKRLHKDNERLKKELAVFDEIDPEDHARLLSRVEELENSDATKDVEAEVQKRVQKMREDADKQIKAQRDALNTATTERDTLRDRLGSVLLDQAVQNRVSNVGRIRQGAMEDVLNRARRTWHVNDDGELQAVDENGEQRFDANSDPLTVEQWAKDLLEAAPYLFEGGGGGGASGPGQRGGGGAASIDGSDPFAIGERLEDVASGKVRVKTG